MTLIVCMKAIDGIVLAADSRGTIGDPRGLTAINDNQVKIFPFGQCGVGFAGASEMGAVLLDEWHKSGEVTCANIDAAVAEVGNASATLFAKWFGSIPPSQRSPVIITLAGYRCTPGNAPQPMIYLLVSQMNFAPQLLGNMPCLSGVPQYAVYLVHRYYDPSISLEKATALAEYLISETASQDPKVGGPIRIAQITPEQGYREMSKEEVSELSNKNGELNLQLRKFFLEVMTK